MQHNHTSEFALWPRSSICTVQSRYRCRWGKSGVCLMFSAAARRKEHQAWQGERSQLAVLQLYQGVHDVQQLLLLPCDDISRFQDVENDDWQGSFPRSRCIEFWSAVPVGVFDIKKGEVPSERLPKVCFGSPVRDGFMPSLAKLPCLGYATTPLTRVTIPLIASTT